MSVRGLPELAIALGGEPLPASTLATLSSIRVQQRLSMPALCELAFVQPQGAWASAGIPSGTRLEVHAAAQAPALFEGEVTAFELVYRAGGERLLLIRGYDLLHRLRKRQRVRAHVQVNLIELARELAADLGVSVESGAPSPRFRHLIQHRESDLELLVDRAARCGQYLTLQGGALRFVTLEGQGPAVSLRLGENLIEASLEVNADPACREVASAGWDVREVEPQRARAGQARVGRSVPAAAPPASVGAPGAWTVVDTPSPGGDHAEAAAQAELDARLAREVVLRAVADGDVRLVPGARVDIQGVGAAVAGRYVLTSVTHVVDAERGFASELSTEPPPRPKPVAAAKATVGVVTRVDAESGRVRVSLPTFSDVETDWMQVVSTGAGAGKGLVMLPDVQDRVLVLFPQGEPSEGVVLGGLWGGPPPDPGVEAGAVRRFTLFTAGGHKVRLDDAARAVRIDDSNGSFLELSPESVRVRSAVPLRLEAPGQSVVIVGKTVDFRRG